MTEESLILRTNEVHLVARNPSEMESARGNLEEWLQQKLGAIDEESAELERAIESASSAPFDASVASALKSQLNRATRRRAFYWKVLAAVQAGYAIIPNFPLELFAVRVTKERPTKWEEGINRKPDLPDEEPANAAAGEGEYKSPRQFVRETKTKERDSEGNEYTRYFIQATDYMDVQFPVVAARAEVLDATAEAMALKVFDQIGICPPQRKGDPLIVGQVRLGGRYSEKLVSFIIAWHLDLRTL